MLSFSDDRLEKRHDFVRVTTYNKGAIGLMVDFLFFIHLHSYVKYFRASWSQSRTNGHVTPIGLDWFFCFFYFHSYVKYFELPTKS